MAIPDRLEHDRDARNPGTFILRAALHLERPRPGVFAFFAAAHNLEAITPPSLRFRIKTPGPIVIARGTLIDYRISLHGVPMVWRTHIARWEPNEVFVDEQLRGPYAMWVHTHTFRDAPGGGTIIEDEVRYRLPFGPLGRLVAPLVRREVERIFRYRTTRVRELLAVVGQGFSPASDGAA